MKLLRNIKIINNYTKEGYSKNLVKKDETAYFHLWVKEYTTGEQGEPQENTRALVENKEGLTFTLPSNYFKFTGVSSDPDEDRNDK